MHVVVKTNVFLKKPVRGHEIKTFVRYNKSCFVYYNVRSVQDTISSLRFFDISITTYFAGLAFINDFINTSIIAHVHDYKLHY